MSSYPSKGPPCEAVRILLVDDEDTFRLSLAAIFRDDGHEVLDYPSALALPPLEHLAPVGVLITDFCMPQQDGLELAEAFHERNPAAPVILVTAHRTNAMDRVAAERDYLQILSKPIDYDDLHELVHWMAARPSAASRR